jgi:hypothetical protein
MPAAMAWSVARAAPALRGEEASAPARPTAAGHAPERRRLLRVVQLGRHLPRLLQRLLRRVRHLRHGQMHRPRLRLRLRHLSAVRLRSRLLLLLPRASRRPRGLPVRVLRRSSIPNARVGEPLRISQTPPPRSRSRPLPVSLEHGQGAQPWSSPRDDNRQRDGPGTPMVRSNPEVRWARQVPSGVRQLETTTASVSANMPGCASPYHHPRRIHNAAGNCSLGIGGTRRLTVSLSALMLGKQSLRGEVRSAFQSAKS